MNSKIDLKPAPSVGEGSGGGERPCWVYFFQSEFGAIKIGVSENVKKRFATISTSTPGKLKHIHSIAFPNRETAFQAERLFHERYKSFSVGGEWFKINPQTIFEDLNFGSRLGALLHKKPEVKSPTLNVGDDKVRSDAIKLFNRLDKASVSLLQRRLGIGYNRASRIFEELIEIGALEEMGMVKDGTRGYVRKKRSY